MNVYEEVKKYLDTIPVPATTPVIATALNLDANDVAKALASLNQRAKPLIARRPVSSERKTNTSMRFEYMSLAVAAELGVVVVPKTYYKPKQKVVQTSVGILNAAAQHKMSSIAEITNSKPANVTPTVHLHDGDICSISGLRDEPEPHGVDALARLIGRRIARTMMQALQEEIEEQLDKMSHDLIEKWVDEEARPMIHRTTPLPSKARLPKVLIAGLLPAQAGMISGEFGEVFDLRFYMTDDNLKKLRNMLPDVDHFITFTSKIEHNAEEIAKSLGIKITRCSGGMTMLRNLLTELYVGASA